MSQAFKCDRCHRFYEQPLVPNSIIALDPKYPLKEGDRYDLCDRCNNDFHKFLNEYSTAKFNADDPSLRKKQ
jgi:hypothetical protein